MNISRIYIEQFGHLKNREIFFHSNMNLIYGKNESGKSTISAFIRCMLFGMDNGRKNDVRASYRKRYIPQGYDFAAGVLEIDDWIISRRFGRTPRYDSCIVTKNEVSYEAVDTIGQVITGMDADTFENTWFVSQFNAYTHINHTIESRLSNLSSAGDETISFSGAMEYLNHLENKYRPARNKTTGLYALETEIADNLSVLQQETDKKKEYEQKKQTLTDLEADLSEIEKQIKVYQAKRQQIDQYVQYRQYCMLSEECSRLKEQWMQTKSILEHAQNDSSKKQYVVYMVFCVLFAAIGMLFLLAFIHPAFSACLISFIPMTFCIIQTMMKRREMRIDRSQGLQKQCEILQDSFKQKSELLKQYPPVQACAAPKEDIAQINRRLEQLQKERITVEKQRSMLQYQIQQYDAAAIEQLQAEQRRLTKEKQRMEFELSCIRLTKDILTQTYREFHHDFIPTLQQKASAVLKQITNGVYTHLLLSEDGDIQVLNHSIYISAALLSNAALDGVYFSLRLGIIELICPSYFLLLDDIFVQYDDERAFRAIECLKKISETHQILYFTCQSRLNEENTIEI